MYLIFCAAILLACLLREVEVCWWLNFLEAAGGEISGLKIGGKEAGGKEVGGKEVGGKEASSKEVSGFLADFVIALL